MTVTIEIVRGGPFDDEQRVEVEVEVEDDGERAVAQSYGVDASGKRWRLTHDERERAAESAVEQAEMERAEDRLWWRQVEAGW